MRMNRPWDAIRFADSNSLLLVDYDRTAKTMRMAQLSLSLCRRQGSALTRVCKEAQRQQVDCTLSEYMDVFYASRDSVHRFQNGATRDQTAL
jgi:hypothetical protein